MLKLNKKILIILVVLSSILLFLNTFTYAVDLNLTDENSTSTNDTANASEDTNVVEEDENAIAEENTSNTNNSSSNSTSSNNTSNTNTTDTSATVSNVNSVSDSELGIGEILTIFLIVIGVLLIFLAIAILIRFKK